METNTQEGVGPAKLGSARLAAAQETMTRYVIVTPIRDEEKFIEATIASVQGQTMPPAEWIIVDDGSTDRTGEIVDHYAARFHGSALFTEPNRGSRKSGGGVMEAFYDGYQRGSIR